MPTCAMPISYLCSPEGIRTPDRFLEREGTQKSDKDMKSVKKDAPD